MKRKHNGAHELLPASKRLCEEYTTQLLDLPTEVLDLIVKRCDKDDECRLACVCKALHRLVSWNQPFTAVVEIPQNCETVLAHVAEQAIYPLGVRLRARPWWFPTEIQLMLHRASFRLRSILPKPDQELDHTRLQSVMELISERAKNRCLTLCGCASNAVIDQLDLVLSRCTTIYVNGGSGLGDSLTIESTSKMAKCPTVILSRWYWIRSDAFTAFKNCSHFFFDARLNIPSETIEYLEKHGVDVFKVHLDVSL